MAHRAIPLPGVPVALLEELRAAAREAGVVRLALVGGVVRDALLHRDHGQPWTGVPDLDLVVEGDAAAVAAALQRRCGPQRLTGCQEHGCFGTVELCLDGWLLDLATARAEVYPAPAENPLVRPGTLQADLVRRDFTINAMAIDLITGELVDPHQGRLDLVERQLVFLHQGSVADDPTRLIRAARYGARLDFDLAPESRRQVSDTVGGWPWLWTPGAAASAAPPALATRLRMELDRLLLHEPWQRALDLLEDWGALPVIEPALQQDPDRGRRLRWAARLGLPLMPALLLAASDPVATAQRLQIPAVQQRWLEQQLELSDWLLSEAPPVLSSPSVWTEALERRPWSPNVVALVVCQKPPLWRPLLRWWGRWRHGTSPVTAKELISAGWRPGPDLGSELQRRRLVALDQGR